MKRYSFAKSIGMSWHWMIQVLFRPFNLKKWIMLGIIILLAGQLGGSFNFSWGAGQKDNKLDEILSVFLKKAPCINRLPVDTAPSFGIFGIGDDKKASTREKAPPVDYKRKFRDFFRKKAGKFTITAAIGVPYLLFVMFLIILWVWVKSGFSFVFIDSVIKNDASLNAPFHKYLPQSNSFFRWSLCYSFIVLFTLGAITYAPIRQLIQEGALTRTPVDVALILSIVALYIPILVVCVVIFGLITMFIWDFVLPIMYKKRCGILQALSIFAKLFTRNIGQMLLYLLVKLGVAILALAAGIVLTILALIFVIVIGGVLVLTGLFLISIIPGLFKVIMVVILLIIGVPLLVFLGFLFNLFYLPILIFFRVFPVHVLGSLDEDLDIFAPKSADELIRAEDDEKYNKSMRMVWFAVLAPGITAMVGVILVIAVPRLLGIKIKGLSNIPLIDNRRKTGIKGLAEDIPKLIEIPKIIPKLQGDIVIVHLTNGSSFEAVIESETEDNIAFKIEGGTVVYPKNEVSSIEDKEEK